MSMLMLAHIPLSTLYAACLHVCICCWLVLVLEAALHVNVTLHLPETPAPYKWLGHHILSPFFDLITKTTF